MCRSSIDGIHVQQPVFPTLLLPSVRGYYYIHLLTCTHHSVLIPTLTVLTVPGIRRWKDLRVVHNCSFFSFWSLVPNDLSFTSQIHTQGFSSIPTSPPPKIANLWDLHSTSNITTIWDLTLRPSVLARISIVVIKHHDQKPLEEKRVCFACR